MPDNNYVIGFDDPILITGANGFIGARVVDALLQRGFRRLRCFSRPSSDLARLSGAVGSGRVELFSGNLLSPQDCARAVQGVTLVFHLAAGIEKTYAGCILNSVVTTRNLLDAIVDARTVVRLVNISSFAVYSNWNLKRGQLLDESCELETSPADRNEAYMYAKLKQEQLVGEYSRRHGIPYVTLRPGAVFGPGAKQLSARVGIGTFGVFLHLGGSNTIPFTYVDNCASAIVAAGLTKGVEGESFNVVDDDLPSSAEFLRRFKREARDFQSISVPYPIFYAFCWAWESYARWSKGQLPPVFNRRRCSSYWKGNSYSNQKLRELVGWRPEVPFAEACRRYFAYERGSNACH